MSTSTADAILACVQRYPGIHLRGVERELGVSSALVHYHVKQLEAKGLLVSALVGGYLRLYPKDAARPLAGDETLAVLREEVPLHVVLLLLERGSITQSELVESLGLAKSTVSYHVDKLVSRGLLVRREKASEISLRLKDARRVRKLLASYSPTPDLVEKFRGIWSDFYGE